MQSTETENKRALVLVPDMPGGMSSLFCQLAEAQPSNERNSLELFYSHDQRPLVILRFPAKFVRFLAKATSGNFQICHLNLAARGSTARKAIFALACRALHLPYVIHLHGNAYRDFFRGLPGIGKAAVRGFFKHAAGVIVLGTVWRDFVVEEIGVDPAKVTILPNAVYGPPNVPKRNNSDPVRVLFLGRLGPRKGVSELLHALAGPSVGELKWHTTIAGDGDVDHYRKMAQELGLADRTDFPGWVGREDVDKLLQEAEILVLPSHSENLPMSMLEGMAYGLCPIVTPVGAVPDVIRDGENGLLVPVGDAKALSDALALVLRHSKTRLAMAKKARLDFEKRYDINKYSKKLQAIYEEILTQS